jgi:tetratricopeptide (TPR) repeat protein
VVCIEDLHWADPSSVELLRVIGKDPTLPLLLICTCRKTFTLFDPDTDGSNSRRLIELSDLLPDQALEMVASILNSPSIPRNLSHFVAEKIEGNPFYLEEMINALIDRKTLVMEGEHWIMHGAADVSDIASTIHGLISGRLDHLHADTKRILQEASVIGRVFDLAILRKITSARERLDDAVETLEHLDMIRETASTAEVKYYFKHAIVQEVVYNGILLRDRRLIHERIAVAMESIFQSRLEGFYETLAFHFSVGQSVYKAVDYLMRSGQKSKQRYAVEEAHRYYQRAYELLNDLPERSTHRSVLLVNVLIEWFFVFNVRGVFNEMIALLKRHEAEADRLENSFLRGMYCCCMGWALQRRESLAESHDYLMRALQIGERADNREVLAYACGCLVWTCTDMGRLDQAVGYGRRAEALLVHMEQDQELIRIILTGSGIAHWFRGAGNQCQIIGETLLAHGEKGADIRSTSDGYLVCAMGRFVSGDFNQAIEYCNMAIASSAEMVHSFNSKFLLAYTFLSSGQVNEAQTVLTDILHHTQAYGYEYLGTAAQALAGMVALAQGNLAAGIKTISDRMDTFKAKGKTYHVMTFTYLLGKVYWQLAMKKGPLNWRLLVKNLPFLVRHLPIAARMAEAYFQEALAMAESMGAEGIAGQIHFDMAQLYDRARKTGAARQCLHRSIAVFQVCEADMHLQEALRYARERHQETPE